ncbi:surface antigen [Ligilactobacillus salitolerans]|uniref:Surface antigen n=1 Tax=Ligilactobacillus salitolerans TaxID=1808352 RepID=A0A401IVZ2_9LACO|nr:CHAP domain-containing protein [Ligilactobacillus salitolerans]GBG95666.1 surface antigen [Ligilactobacillus salitolerans]
MKKNLLKNAALFLATITTLGAAAPSVMADTASDLDQVNSEITATKGKISNLEKKINQETELQMKKSQKISELKIQISQRDSQLKKQARSAQINNGGSVLKFVTDADNITEAVSRSISAGRIIYLNDKTMKEQVEAKKQVQKEQVALTKSVQSQKNQKLSLYRTQATLGAKRAELAAKKDKEDAAKQAAAKKAAQAAADAKKAKDTQTASLAADRANQAANSEKTQANEEAQNKAVSQSNSNPHTTTVTKVSTSKSYHGVGGGANGYPVGQCTYYVKMAAPWVGGHWGNGQEWAGSAAAAGFRVDHTPAPGAVAVYAGGADVGGWTAAPGYGHVALVQSVNGSSVTITQGGTGFSNPLGPNTQTLSAGAAMAYIHPNN